jgi:hypothetical protein
MENLISIKHLLNIIQSYIEVQRIFSDELLEKNKIIEN